MDTLILLLRLLLVAVFAVAGAAKLRDLKGSRVALEEFGVPARFAAAGGVLLPVAELAVAAALLFPPSARWGAAAAVLLLALFVAAIANAMAHDRAPDCHCFGQLHSEPAGRGTLIRNSVLIALAGAVAAFGPGPGVHTWIGDRSAPELILAAAVVAALAFATLRLLAWSAERGRQRQEAKLAAEMESLAGHPIGSPAPKFELPSVEGPVRTLDELCARGRPVLLVFIQSDCGACHVLLPRLSAWQSRLQSQLTIAVLSEGSAESNRASQAYHAVDELLLQERGEIYHAYGFRHGTPAAVVVDPDGTIASVAVSGDLAVEELVRLTLQRIDAVHEPSVAA